MGAAGYFFKYNNEYEIRSIQCRGNLCDVINMHHYCYGRYEQEKGRETEVDFHRSRSQALFLLHFGEVKSYLAMNNFVWPPLKYPVFVIRMDHTRGFSILLAQ